MYDRRAVTDEMPEANYLVGHPDGRYYRLLMRCFYERYRMHASYVRSDELLAYVRQYLPYEEADCRRHLDMMETWHLVTLLPDQTKPNNLLELRQRPRTYRAERLALRLEALRVEHEEGESAASLDPAALDLLLSRVTELANWVEAGGLLRDDAASQQKSYLLWSAVYSMFDAFTRKMEEYLDDLPRHRPREALDYAAFMEYRDLIAGYLQDFVSRIYSRREQLRFLLGPLAAQADLLATILAAVEVEQIRADGSRPQFQAQKARFVQEVRAVTSYFAPQGDVDVLLASANGWISEITRHAKRLSEQHLGGSIREQTLLDLARRFTEAAGLQEAQALAQVIFAATLPLHWRGEAPPPAERPAWQGAPTLVTLYPVRRGTRQKNAPESTVDRSDQALQQMIDATERRKRAAQELSALFGPSGEIDLGALTVQEGAQRQLLLRLLYKALSQRGAAGVGYHNWSVTVHLPEEAALGQLTGPDGMALLPRAILRLHKGGSV